MFSTRFVKRRSSSERAMGVAVSSMVSPSGAREAQPQPQSVALAASDAYRHGEPPPEAPRRAFQGFAGGKETTGDEFPRCRWSLL